MFFLLACYACYVRYLKYIFVIFLIIWDQMISHILFPMINYNGPSVAKKTLGFIFVFLQNTTWQKKTLQHLIKHLYNCSMQLFVLHKYIWQCHIECCNHNTDLFKKINLYCKILGNILRISFSSDLTAFYCFPFP